MGSHNSSMLALSFAPFRLLPEQRLLLADEKPVRLGRRVLDILIALAERPGELVSKDESVPLSRGGLQANSGLP